VSRLTCLAVCVKTSATFSPEDVGSVRKRIRNTEDAAEVCPLETSFEAH
jgi:hypothetical protein